MGHKIFISYKYGDASVQRFTRTPFGSTTTVRDYVDELQDKLATEDHINKGELDGEDLSSFKDSTIQSKLRDKIYDSSVTIVLISPNMKEPVTPEEDQWIPWEVSYSLRETTRNDRTSRRNGMLAVVLPDRNGNYDYMLEPRACCSSTCTLWHRDKLFRILGANMFNRHENTHSNCQMGSSIYSGYSGYIHMVRWDTFIDDINYWIGVAEKIRNDKDTYDIQINV